MAVTAGVAVIRESLAVVRDVHRAALASDDFDCAADRALTLSLLETERVELENALFALRAPFFAEDGR